MLLIGGVVTSPAPAYAAAPAPVDLASAATLTWCSAALSVTNGGGVHDAERGSRRLRRGFPPPTITGLPDSLVVGTTHNGDPQAAQAYTDINAAYNDALSRTPDAPLAGDQNGVTLSPGVYYFAAAFAQTGILTLDGQGDANAVFIVKVNAAFTMAALAEVKLINGVQASRVFWQVNGAAGFGANAKFEGTVMAHDAIGLGAGAIINGRARTDPGVVTLDSNNVYTTPPSLTITGGATTSVMTITPTIAGATDLAAGQSVLVTIDEQSLQAEVQAGGVWSATTAPIVNGTYTVVATVADPQGNMTTATQSFTIYRILPIVTITVVLTVMM